MKTKYAAALIIPNDTGEILLPKRSENRIFPGVISLPSVSFDKDADPRKELQEAVRKRLGIEVEVMQEIGTKKGMQKDYWLELTDYQGKIIGGELNPNLDYYSEAEYLDPIRTFEGKDMGKQGFCTQILIEKLKEGCKFT
jgi:hypothetical protein